MFSQSALTTDNMVLDLSWMSFFFFIGPKGLKLSSSILLGDLLNSVLEPEVCELGKDPAEKLVPLQLPLLGEVLGLVNDMGDDGAELVHFNFSSSSSRLSIFVFKFCMVCSTLLLAPIREGTQTPFT